MKGPIMATKESAPSNKYSPFGKASKFTAEARVIKLEDVSIIEDFNPRQYVGDIEELKSNIAKAGLINPPTVRPTDVDGKFELIAGHRRYASLVSLGRDSSLFIIREDLTEDGKATAYAIAENSEDGRTNLTHVEMGSTFVGLMETEGWKNDRIAKETGVAKHTVRRCIKLMQLDQEILDMVQDGRLSATAAIAFSKLDPTIQEKIDTSDLPDASAHLIKSLAVDAMNKIKAEDAAEAKESGEDGEGSDADKGRKKGKVKVLWRTPKERNEMIEQLAYDHLESDDDWAAELATLYWLRGHGETINDLKSKDFDSLVKADAMKYESKQEKEPIEEK